MCTLLNIFLGKIMANATSIMRVQPKQKHVNLTRRKHLISTRRQRLNLLFRLIRSWRWFMIGMCLVYSFLDNSYRKIIEVLGGNWKASNDIYMRNGIKRCENSIKTISKERSQWFPNYARLCLNETLKLLQLCLCDFF